MFKLVKWAYVLGVRQERTRIARVLETEMIRQQNENSIIEDMLNGDNRLSKKSQETLDFKLGVSHRINEIINRIFQPKWEEQGMHSIMWPEDMFEEKK